MDGRFSNFFDSYDLFAKAFPGTIFFLFFLSLLPETAFNITLDTSSALIAGIIVLILVMGFVFGQAIHSVAVQIENGFYITSAAIYNYIFISRKIFRFVIKPITRRFGSEKDQQNKRIDNAKFTKYEWFVLVTAISFPIILGIVFESLVSILIGYMIGIFTPINRVRLWARQILVPHRRLYDERIDSYTNNKSGDDDNDDLLIKRFEDRLSLVFDDFEGLSTNPNKKMVYILTMSHLEYTGGGRARQFQAIFSFCRSMWSTLFIFSILYIIIGLEIQLWNLPVLTENTVGWLEGYRPLILSQIGGRNAMSAVGVSMLVSMLFFMEGERQYKSLFIDYLFADFLTSTRSFNKISN